MKVLLGNCRFWSVAQEIPQSSADVIQNPELLIRGRGT